MQSMRSRNHTYVPYVFLPAPWYCVYVFLSHVLYTLLAFTYNTFEQSSCSKISKHTKLMFWPVTADPNAVSRHLHRYPDKDFEYEFDMLRYSNQARRPQLSETERYWNYLQPNTPLLHHPLP